MKLLWMLVVLLLAPAAPAEEHIQSNGRSAEGETCLVCNKRVSKKDACYLADGQRVAVHAADCCEGEFLRHPAKYLASLRPSDILFSSGSPNGMAVAWFWAGLYVLSGLLFGALCAARAVGTERSPLRWFLAGLAGSAASYVYMRMTGGTPEAALPSGLQKVARTREPVRCPGCGASNHPAARNCSRCRSELVPVAPSETAAIRPS